MGMGQKSMLIKTNKFGAENHKFLGWEEGTKKPVVLEFENIFPSPLVFLVFLSLFPLTFFPPSMQFFQQLISSCKSFGRASFITVLLLLSQLIGCASQEMQSLVAHRCFVCHGKKKPQTLVKFCSPALQLNLPPLSFEQSYEAVKLKKSV